MLESSETQIGAKGIESLRLLNKLLCLSPLKVLIRMSNINLNFRSATDSDMKSIYTWLVEQDKRGVHGSFLCNWNLTREIYEEEKIIVGIQDGFPIAYMWVNFGIVEVHEEFRGKGAGRKLVTHGVELLRKAGDFCIRIECAPTTSIPFWLKMGFELYSDKDAYLTLENKVSLPSTGVPVEVEICVYPESKKWNPETSVHNTFRPKAVRDSSGVIVLDNRVVVFTGGKILGRKPVVIIKIEGSEVLCDTTKSPNASKLGFQYGNCSYAIEKIYA
jgi:GNAT superfamily N-acetyltransferase